MSIVIGRRKKMCWYRFIGNRLLSAFWSIALVTARRFAEMLLESKFNKKLTIMSNSKSLLVDTCRLNYLIESRQDSKGSTSFYVTCANGKFHFRSIDSVLDFINSNSFGYVG